MIILKVILIVALCAAMSLGIFALLVKWAGQGGTLLERMSCERAVGVLSVWSFMLLLFSAILGIAYWIAK